MLEILRRETSAASRATSAPRPAGKLAPALLARLIELTLPPEVALGPRIGEDACAIEIEGRNTDRRDGLRVSRRGTDRGTGTVNSNQATVSYPSRHRAR